MKERIKLLKEAVKNGAVTMTDGQSRQLGNYDSMLRNINEEGYTGGESGVQPIGLNQCDQFLKKFGY